MPNDLNPLKNICINFRVKKNKEDISILNNSKFITLLDHMLNIKENETDDNLSHIIELFDGTSNPENKEYYSYYLNI